MVNEPKEISGCREQERRYSKRANIYLGATILSAIVGFGGFFGVRNNDILKYSLVIPGAVISTITAELHSRTLKRRDYYRGKINDLESD